MPDVKPLKANLTGAGNLDSLAEFEDTDFVDIDDGGTGSTTFTSGEVLVGQGTSAITSVSRGNLIAGSTKLTINDGTSVSDVVLGQNVTIDLIESSIDINNTTGQIGLSRVLHVDPGTIDAHFSQSEISEEGQTPGGDTNHDGGSSQWP
jgi:hypothetical protein